MATHSPAPRGAPEPHLSDPPPFDDFYRQSYPSIVRLGILLVDDRPTAEEIAQDAFLRTQARYDELTNAIGFTRTCVINAGRDVMRRRKVRRNAVLQLPDPPSPQHRELDDVLIRLPYRERAAVVCRYYLDLHEDDTAALLGVAPSTVRALIARALTTLRKEIQP